MHANTTATEIETDIENERNNEIDALRGVLGAGLNDALHLLQAAERQIGRLASQLYDIEYAESTTGADLRHVVADAARAVRIALTLQQQIEATPNHA